MNTVAPSSRRSRATKTVKRHVEHSFPAPLAIALSGVAVVFSILLSGYVYSAYAGSLSVLASAGTPTSLVGRVARHIAINVNEEPTIATVQDPESLRATDLDFYKDAAIGDRLLVWSDKAVLYSEARDLILSVLPIHLTNSEILASSAAQTSDQIKSEGAKIEIRNGTRRTGLGKSFADKLAKLSLGFDVLKPRDAVKKNYAQTIIVKISDKSFPETERQLLQVLGNVTLQTLPTAETNVKGDYLVILGADYTP